MTRAPPTFLFPAAAGARARSAANFAVAEATAAATRVPRATIIFLIFRVNIQKNLFKIYKLHIFDKEEM